MAKVEDILRQGDPRRKEIQAVFKGVTDYHMTNFDPPEPSELITLGGNVGSSEWSQVTLTKLLSHLLMIGESGSGKSQMLKRIAYEILFNEDKNLSLYVVDGKGDEEFAKTMAVMACAAGKPPGPIVRLGWADDTPSAVFDAFAEADALDICNRLEFLYDLKKKGRESDWYTIQHKAILKLISGVNSEYLYGVKVEPPRSFDELGDRLDYDGWLEPTYKGTKAMRIIKPFAKEIPNLYALTQSLISGIAPIVAPGGFKLSDYPVVIFSINYEARKDDAEVLFRLLGACIGSQISTQKRKYRGFWLIDEFGKFGAEIIASVITQARSKLMGIIIAMQTIASLGENFQHAEEIKSGTGTQILMRTNNAGDLIDRAGMKKVRDISINTRDGEESFTQRWKDVFRVEPTELHDLEDGEAFIVQRGNVQRIMGNLIDDYNDSMFDEAMEDLSVSRGVVHLGRASNQGQSNSAGSTQVTNPNQTP